MTERPNPGDPPPPRDPTKPSTKGGDRPPPRDPTKVSTRDAEPHPDTKTLDRRGSGS